MLKGFSFAGAGRKVVSCAVLLLMGSGFVSASDHAGLLERIKPAGLVCIEGQDCKKAAVKMVKKAEVVVAVAEAAPVVEVATAAVASVSGEETYNKTCAMCHANGTAGAPKLGDAAAWATRSEKGLDGMLAIAKKGVNAMPPMGMCMTCSDDDLKAAIVYMAHSGE